MSLTFDDTAESSALENSTSESSADRPANQGAFDGLDDRLDVVDPPDEATYHSGDDIDKGTVMREYRAVIFKMSHIGLNYGIAVGMCAYLGYLLDKELDSQPWMILVGVALGLAAGTKELLRAMRWSKRVQRDKTKAETRARHQEAGPKPESLEPTPHRPEVPEPTDL